MSEPKALKPKCPNHGCPLDVSPKELTAGRGVAPCQISGAMFEWQVDPATKFKDKFGNEFVTIKVTGNEN